MSRVGLTMGPVCVLTVPGRRTGKPRSAPVSPLTVSGGRYVAPTTVSLIDSITSSAEYSDLLESIKATIAAGRLRAARAVNNVLVQTYWEIGRHIVQRQREQGWSARVIDRLAVDLRTAHPGMRGISVRNLHYMAALAIRWPSGIVQHAAAELPWGQVMVLLDKCPSQETSDFYAERAAAEGWTRGVGDRGAHPVREPGVRPGPALLPHAPAQVSWCSS